MKLPGFIALVLITGLMSLSAQAANVTFEVSFVNSSFQVDENIHDFSDLLDAHNAGSVISTNTVNSVEGIDTSVYAGNISGNYGVMMSATLNVADAGNYRFQVGTDWGRGGGVALFDTATDTIIEEYVTDEDIWWARRWDHRDVIDTDYDLTQGMYTIVWLGFEGCCAGESTVRFSFNGAPFQTLNVNNITPHVVPVPASVWLLGSAFVALTTLRRRNQTTNT